MLRSCKAAVAVVCIFLCLYVIPTRVVTQSLPGSWGAIEIGAPILSGNAAISKDGLVVDAAGEGIQKDHDQFFFVYRAVVGDVDVRARIEGVTSVSESARAGVMIRAGLTGNAAHASALISAAGRVTFERRQTAGAFADTSTGPEAIQWLRVVRAGLIVTAYASRDGESWTILGSDVIALGSTAYVGLAVTSEAPGIRTTAQIKGLSAESVEIPAGPIASDVGTPAIVGRSSVANERFTISAAGAGIGGQADEFHFVSQPVIGDVEVIARVESITNAHSGAIAGVMIREDLTATAPNALMAVTRQSGWLFSRRREAGGGTERSDGGKGGPPGWVRLVRDGPLIEAFRSDDGQTWTWIGTDTIEMSEAVYIGIAVASGNPHRPMEAVVDSFAVNESWSSASPPVVAMTSPLGGTALAPADVTLSAAAFDPDGTLSFVEFYVGSSLHARRTSPPYTSTLTGLAEGTYVLRALAVDDRGFSTLSEPLTLVVKLNQLASIQLASPPGLLVAPAKVTVTATASGIDASVTAVDFFLGGAFLARDTASPYSVTLTDLPAGSYTLRAVATDDRGRMTEAQPLTITVTDGPAPAVPRGIAFTVPPENETKVTSYRLEVYAIGAIPGVSAPIDSADLGKPTPSATGEILVERPEFFSALAPGHYLAVVTAIGAVGSVRSAPLSFVR